MGIRSMREMTVRVGQSLRDIKFIYSRNSDACNVKNTHLDSPGDYCTFARIFMQEKAAVRPRKSENDEVRIARLSVIKRMGILMVVIK